MDFKNLIPFGRKNVPVRRDEDHPFAVMQREMNRIFDSFFENWEQGDFPDASGAFVPRVEVSEDSGTFTVSAELPGMTEKDIDVYIAGDVLTIKGEKKQSKEEKSGNYFYSERSYGSFSRSIPLPRQVDSDKISADFKKGLLRITLPKNAAAAEETKKIPVRTE